MHLRSNSSNSSSYIKISRGDTLPLIEQCLLGTLATMDPVTYHQCSCSFFRPWPHPQPHPMNGREKLGEWGFEEPAGVEWVDSGGSTHSHQFYCRVRVCAQGNNQKDQIC